MRRGFLILVSSSLILALLKCGLQDPLLFQRGGAGYAPATGQVSWQVSHSPYFDNDPTALLTQGNRILLVGRGDSHFALYGILSTGALDTSFGTGGSTRTVTGGQSLAFGAGLQSNGKIIVGGTTTTGINMDFLVARYSANGILDTSFGTSGKTTTAIFGNSDEARQVLVQPDDKIVLAGSAVSGGNRIVLVRYTANGALDTAFATGGIQSTANGAAVSASLHSDGRIVTYNLDFGLARYTAAGALDTSFGTGGVATSALPTGVANSGVALPGGEYVVAGIDNGYSSVALARYLSNGSIDTSFGTGGTVVTDLGEASQANRITYDPEGKLVVVGHCVQGGIYRLLLLRYLSNGALDTSFGTGGKVITGVSANPNYGSGVLVRSDGKILVAGKNDVGGFNQLALMLFQ